MSRGRPARVSKVKSYALPTVGSFEWELDEAEVRVFDFPLTELTLA